MIIPYPTVEVRHIWRVYVTSEPQVQAAWFLYYNRSGMNFHSCKKQISEPFGCLKFAKTQNEPKRDETK